MTVFIETNKPIAYDSPDHVEPWGTANNNSTNRWFNKKLFAITPPKDLRVMDLGCSGGGFVKSIIDAGGFAVGVEGSDYSQKHKRAEWATIPDRLFTADITEPFQFLQGSDRASATPIKFNVVTAWEVFEHIADDKIDMLVENILKHLETGGIFLGSIAPFEDVVNGVRLHQSVHELPWWIDRMAKLGMTNLPHVEEFFFCDWVRGGVGTASYAVAFGRTGDPQPDPARLKSAKRTFLPHEYMRKLKWKLGIGV